MFTISAAVQGLPLPKERQLEILIELLAAVQGDVVSVTSAVFGMGGIVINAEILKERP